MLTSKGTPASGWSVNFTLFRRQPAIVGGWSTISKRIINIWSWIAKISIIALVSLNLRWIPRRTRFLRWKRKWKRLISKWWRRRKQRMHIGEKMQTVSKWPAKTPLKKIHQQRDEFNKQNDSEAFAVKYDKEVYQPAIAACHKQSEECYEVPIQQKRDFDINEQRRQTFLQSQKLSRKLQDDWVTLEKGQYPLTMKVSEINSKKSRFWWKLTISTKLMNAGKRYRTTAAQWGD